MNHQLVALHTLARKETIRILRIWPQTLLPSAITMVLYFLIFGKFIGSQLDDIHGVSYIEFIVPGLIMMAVITTSYMNTSSSFFVAKFQRSIEELLVSPASTLVLIAGFCAGGIVRAGIVGILVTLVALFFTSLSITNVFVILSFGLLTTLLFCLGGLVNAVYAKKFDDISIVPTFVLTPLTYLSGIFYSISLLPGFWQGLSKLNPILYMVNGFRYGFLGFSDINVWIAFGMLLVFTTGLFFWCYHLLQRGYGLRS